MSLEKSCSTATKAMERQLGLTFQNFAKVIRNTKNRSIKSILVQVDNQSHNLLYHGFPIELEHFQKERQLKIDLAATSQSRDTENLIS